MAIKVKVRLFYAGFGEITVSEKCRYFLLKYVTAEPLVKPYNFNSLPLKTTQNKV